MTSKHRIHRSKVSLDGLQSPAYSRRDRRSHEPIPAIPDAATRADHIRASLRHRRGDNQTTKGTQPTMNDELIPLSHLVIEGFGASVRSRPSIDTLERRLTGRGMDVVIDDVGRRCVSRSDAATLFAERAEQQAAAERARAERTRAGDGGEVAALHRQLEARHAVQRQLIEADPSLSVYALLASGDTADRLDYKGRRLERLLAGKSEGFRFSPNQEGS
jgi:hypothetical protein